MGMISDDLSFSGTRGLEPHTLSTVCSVNMKNSLSRVPSSVFASSSPLLYTLWNRLFEVKDIGRLHHSFVFLKRTTAAYLALFHYHRTIAKAHVVVLVRP